MRDFFIVRTEWREALNDLSVKDKALLLDIMFAHNAGDDVKIMVDSNKNIQMVWKIISKSFEVTNSVYSIKWNAIDDSMILFPELEINKSLVKTPKGRIKEAPPTIEEIEVYCNERRAELKLDKYIVDAKYFHKYYENLGWQRPNSKSKRFSWKNAILTWEKSALQRLAMTELEKKDVRNRFFENKKQIEKDVQANLFESQPKKTRTI